MNENDSLTRRDFLAASGKTVTATATLQALSALSIALSAVACGSSSASPGSAPNAPSSPNLPTNRLKSPRPEDWPNNVGNGKQVVILGAGISGLVTAFEMNKLGYACTILEATDRVGGRVRTIRSGDQVNEIDSSQVCTFDQDETLYFNAGAARIPHHHDLLIGYCREFNVALETFINENKAARLHSTNSFGGQARLARQLESDSQGFIGELLATSINQGALDSQLSTQEKNNLLGFLQQFASLDNNFSYQGSSRAGFLGQQNSASRDRDINLAPLARDQILQSEFWQFKLDFFKGINQQATMLQPIGGMDAIPKAFEVRVGGDIIYQAVVQQIRKTTSGVRVIYSDQLGTENRIDADYCVCSIPATVLRDIPNDFSAAHQSEISNFTYSRAGKLAFQSPRFWETQNNIYGGISWTDQDITQLWYPSNGFAGNNGIILGGYTFGTAQGNRFSQQSVSERINSGINQANQIHSEYGDNVVNGISVSWPKIPFQLGGWGNSQANVLLTEDDNIFFAGEHLSILQGWQEGAILSAYSAIDLIVAKDAP